MSASPVPRLAFAITAVALMTVPLLGSSTEASANSTNGVEIVLPEGPGWISFVAESHDTEPLWNIYVEVDILFGMLSFGEAYRYNATDPYADDGYSAREPIFVDGYGLVGDGFDEVRVDVEPLEPLSYRSDSKIHPPREELVTFRLYGSLLHGMVVYVVGNASFQDIRVLRGTIIAADSGNDTAYYSHADLEEGREGPFVTLRAPLVGRKMVRSPHELELTADRPFFGELRARNVVEPDGTNVSGGWYQPWAEGTARASTAGTYTLQYNGREGGEPALWAAWPRFVTVDKW